MTAGGNAIPVGFNQLGKLSVQRQSLPLQAVFPALEEGNRSTFGTAVPELPEGLLEDVGCFQAPVGQEQSLQGASPIQAQVHTSREQCVTLALDVAPILAAETLVLAAPDFIENL